MESLLELRWMLPPFVVCLILVGIHGYLGIHVIMRKVIFVDLALAQIAALGTVYAVVLGYQPDAPEDAAAVYGFSLGFTVIGAGVFALTRMRHEKVPHEALIGICYATASALAILILAKTPAEGERLKTMLVGNILLVSWPLIGKTAAVYAVVGLVHLIFYRHFRAISENYEAAGGYARLWDFLFYLTFGLVITSSVSIAGVLLVFTYLVVPASFAILFVDSFGARVVLAWIMGTLCSGIGMLVSYYGDLPTGPAVVVVFAGVLTIGAVTRAVLCAERPRRAVLTTILSIVMLATAVRGSLEFRKVDAEHQNGDRVERLLAALQSENEPNQIEAIHHLVKSGDRDAAKAIVDLLANDPSDRLLEHAAEALGDLGDRDVASALLSAGERPVDPDLRLTIAEALFKLRDPRGMMIVLAALQDDPPPLVWQRGRDLLRRHVHYDLDTGPAGSDRSRADAVASLAAWWRREGQSLRSIEQ